MSSRLIQVFWLILSLAILLCACAAPSDQNSMAPSPDPDATETIAPTPAPTPEPTPEPTPTPTATPVPVKLVEYAGETYYHVFYHFLIAYPDIAYSTSYGANLDTDCITPTEFRRSLEELYKNGFVLCDLNELYEKNDDGTVRLIKIMVPEGKKPLVMSFDDLNYSPKKVGLGICDKIVIDPATDKLAMLTIKDGIESITYDNDVVPMLEAFCEEFPDFAPFGVKGMICLTGFEGILGYRTQADSPNRASEIEAALPVVQRLKDNGWYFASHGYGHLNEERNKLDVVQKDARDWKEEVAPLIGETKIHVFPFGAYNKAGLWDGRFTAPHMRYLIDEMGYEVLCGVGISPFFKVVGEVLFTDRANVDGVSLRAQKEALRELMDPNYVYCPEERDNRPITWKAP